ncbi:MAG: response regulator [Desulfobacterota bacterium]|nr:response regulator [Thermodesulfobacteriota bacterium]
MTVPAILLVDDEEHILSSLKRLLCAEDYAVLTATSGEQGLRLLENNPVGLIISDQRMPGMNGTEFLARARQCCPDAVRIMLTAYSDMEATIGAINRGEIYRFITKPWQDEELKMIVRDALERYRLVQENKRLTRELREWNARLEQRVREQTAEIEQQNKELMQLNKKLQENFKSSLQAFASLIELRDMRLSNHAHNVASIAVKIADEIKVSQQERDTIEAAALLHDIGKIGVPDSVLAKQPKDLTAEERRQLEQHPIRGQAALEPIESLREAAVLVRHHHEWYNGDGYPDRLRFDNIPLGSRIIAIADAIDRHANPGRRGGAYDVMRAFRIVYADRRTHYDEHLMPALEKIVRVLDAGADKTIGTGQKACLPEELVPGMVLAEDIRTGTGILVLPAGTALKHEHILALKRYFELDPSGSSIRVWLKQKA